ncbi:MAG: hypothetical protein ACREPM_16180 [Gemmatimonadaceae bacterium]
MFASLPPYAVAPTPFRFAALAALAGRAALGGQREVALATYMAARLAHDLLPDQELDPAIRGDRAVAARNWLSTVALAPPVKSALMRLVEASNVSRAAAAAALRGVIAVTVPQLDKAARLELDLLAESLERR